MRNHVFLRFGETQDGELVEIERVHSGKTALVCPFCKQPLIAVRGKIKANHFRHEQDTCNESMQAIPEIPGWHHFHLNFKSDTVERLKAAYNPETKNSLEIVEHSNLKMDITQAEYHALTQVNTWTGAQEFTETAQIILGILSPVKFACWMREKLQERVRDNLDLNHDHDPWFRIEAQRQQSILCSTLYLNEYRMAGGSVIHKIGRTGRDVNERLPETVIELQKATKTKVVKACVLRSVPNAGYVEKYFLHRYSDFNTPMGTLTEYLTLDSQQIKRLKTEFTKLISNAVPFNKPERYIVTGRWRYEKKRLDSVKRGMQLTKKHNWTRGRPVGTKQSTSDYLNKHSLIVTLLKQGRSLQYISDFAKVGRSTVQRVRKILKEHQ